MPIYLYWGEEEFNVELAVKKLRNKVLDPDWATFNHKILIEPGIKTLIETISTVPMGFGDLLVEVHNLNLFSKKEKDKDKPDEKIMKALFEALSNIPDRVHLLFVVLFPRNSKKKIDKGLKITKFFEQSATIQHFDSFKPWDNTKVISWLNDAAVELNVKITHDAAQKMFDTVGPELRKLNSELNKLATYVGDGKTIKINDIEELCSGIENVFVLAEKWVIGKNHDALIELKKILDKDHPIKVIATLQTIITQWMSIKLELKYGNSSNTIADSLGIHPFVLGKTIQSLRSVAPERLIHLKENLTVTENKIKTGEIEPELGMEILLTK